MVQIPTGDVIYVRSVEGHLVERFATCGTSSPVYIGATRGATGPVWRTDAIVAIPRAEFNRYRREYTRALSDGSIKLVSDEERRASEPKIKAAAKAAAKPQPAATGVERTEEKPQ